VGDADAQGWHDPELGGPDYIAHVSKRCRAGVPKLINEVHHALANAGQGGCYAGEGRTDQSPKRISPAWECGKQFYMLKRHLNTDHQMTPEQYRQKWRLPRS